MVQGDVLKISLLIYSPSVAEILKRSLNYFEMDAQQTLKRNKDSSLTSLKKIIEVKQEIIERISL